MTLETVKEQRRARRREHTERKERVAKRRAEKMCSGCTDEPLMLPFVTSSLLGHTPLHENVITTSSSLRELAAPYLEQAHANAAQQPADERVRKGVSYPQHLESLVRREVQQDRGEKEGQEEGQVRFG